MIYWYCPIHCDCDQFLHHYIPRFLSDSMIPIVFGMINIGRLLLDAVVCLGKGFRRDICTGPHPNIVVDEPSAA